MNEPGCEDKSIAEIATEMFSYCDGFSMSAKKDGHANMGGMSGRDIMALACGLYESCDFHYTDNRVKQCEYLAQGFYKAGVKGVVLPAGGHAVYINMDEFFDGKRGHLQIFTYLGYIMPVGLVKTSDTHE